MLGILFLLFFAGMVVSSGGFAYLIAEKRMKDKRNKHFQQIKKVISTVNEDKIIPILKERNITNFLLKDGDIQMDIAYNGKTIFVNLKADIYKDEDIESIYSFEYDLEKDFLIYTNRDSYTYAKKELYEEINPLLSMLTDKLIDFDWSKKSEEPTQTIKTRDNSTVTNTTEFDNLKNKAKSILKYVDLLDDNEKEIVQKLIKDEIEKTISFYNKLSDEEKKKYEPVIIDKLKDIDEELEVITNKIEERKYKEFKEKLKKLTIEDENEQ